MQGYGAGSATSVFKDAAYCHNQTQGMYCDVPKQENRVWDYLHVADEILYSVKTDSRGGCRVADRAEFVLMSGYGNMIQAQA